MKENIDFKFSKDDVDYLLSTKSIRDKASQIYEMSLQGKTNFIIDEQKYEEAADFVLETIKTNYPDLKIPYHSRWGHFNSPKKNRVDEFFDLVSPLDKVERGRREFDLIIISVLLDAGAGKTWSYRDEQTGEKIGRSEGLAVASYDMFKSGLFSCNPGGDPYRVDAKKLTELTVEDLRHGFQVDANNELEGLEGRLSLLKSLGETILSKKEFFKVGTPGSLLDYILESVEGDKLEAEEILHCLLRSLGKIWPGRVTLGGQSLGDVWIYGPMVQKETPSCLVPFHKLSQWLSYSLIESIERLNIQVVNLDALTGLAEYRNGGLFVDLGVFSLKEKEMTKVGHCPDEDLIIEWRALTIIGLDKIASLIRKKLKISSIDFPLPKVLEGGTWHAGRKIAKHHRPYGTPPIKIISDGTVF
ncbi:MAG: uracil phosphoribosyltransferase [Halobacteriovoraceae bacterium]|nr:uracil phosphoribosyltransferase [Halobacteriovoraceae bacterium]